LELPDHPSQQRRVFCICWTFASSTRPPPVGMLLPAPSRQMDIPSASRCGCPRCCADYPLPYGRGPPLPSVAALGTFTAKAANVPLRRSRLFAVGATIGRPPRCGQQLYPEGAG